MEVELAQVKVDRFLCSKESKKHNLSSSERLMLLALANRIGKKIKCWPPQEYLAEYMNMTIRSITSILSSLEYKKLIEIERKGKNNIYSLSLPINENIEPDQEKDTCNHCTYEPGSSEMVAPMNQVQVQPFHPNISIQANNSNEPNNTPLFTDVNAMAIFDQFWEAYPRKQNKKKAQKVWGNKKLDKKLDFIVSDIEKRKLSDHQWKDKQYIPLATTYLNGERWEDEIISEQSQPKTKQGNSGYQKQEIKSTVKDFQPTAPEEPKTEEEIKRSAFIQEEEMVKIRKMTGINKHTRFLR